VTAAAGRPESRATDYQYDCGFGAVTRITDRDNNVVKTILLDSIGRQASVTDAFGTLLARTMQTMYDDTNRTERDAGLRLARQCLCMTRRGR